VELNTSFPLPEDWAVRRLDDLVEFLDSRRRPVKASDRAKMRGVIPYYGASGIVGYVDDYLFDEELVLLGEDGENILSRNTRLAFVIAGKAWVNNHAHVLKPKRGVNASFLAEYLESLDFSQFNTGTAQPKLNKKICSEIPVAVPVNEMEQQVVAEVVNNADGLIKSLEQLLAKKRQIKQGAMQELLTGRRRLPGFERSCGFKKSEVGPIPADWYVSTFGAHFTIQLGKMLDSERNHGIPKPFLGNRAVRWGEVDVSDLGEVRLTPTDLQRFRLRDGDLLVCEGGEVGRAAIWNGLIEECYYQKALHRLRPIGAYNVQLAMYWLHHCAMTGTLANYITQTSIAHLPKDKFEKVPLPVPGTVAEQSAIATRLFDMDMEIAAVERRLWKFRQLKQGMMQQLLTGRIRLVDATTADDLELVQSA
jgi:type I restriction enzyme S subunit